MEKKIQRCRFGDYEVKNQIHNARLRFHEAKVKFTVVDSIFMT